MNYTKLIISGEPGAGSTSLSLLLSYYLKMKLIYAGMIQRKLAKASGYEEEGERFVEYTKVLESKYDIEVDKAMRKYILENDNVIADSKINGFFDYPSDVFKVYLLCSREVRNERILAQGRKDGLKLLEERENANRLSFIKIYGFDMADEATIRKHYDLVIDSSKLNIPETLELILNGFGKKFDKSTLVELDKKYWELKKDYFRAELSKQGLLADVKDIVKDIMNNVE
ncbi:MAG: AAA family ATPase [bacterium]